MKTALCVAAFAKVLAAGLFAFYAARRLGLQSPTAFLVGAAYQCGASTLLWLDNPVSDVVPWVPLFFLFAERLALGQPVYWPYGALIGAVALLGGAPEAVGGMALYFFCYVLARCVIARSAPVAPSLAALAGALLLAMGLAGV
ncbi:hypothetical protein IIC44_01345, partial [Patescibacteria group bacterium]|nr:hypothetical protein [Patescibacteria group bacterium]